MTHSAAQVRFGIVTAWPEEDWHSRRLAAACRRFGAVSCLDPAALSLFTGNGARALAFGLGAEGARRVDAFLLVRGFGRSGDPDVQFEIYRALEATGAVVANGIDALLAAQDKLRTSWLLHRAEVATPPAGVAQRPADALALLARFGESVLKPLTGSLGDGVVHLHDSPPDRRQLLRTLEESGAVYLQRYVEQQGRDARLFVVGRRVVGAMERIASPREWRTNVGRGAHVRPLRPSRDLESKAIGAVRALGLDWAGVDLACGPEGATVLEVNGNPSWKGILEATGKDMAEPIAEHVWSRARRRVECLEITQGQARANHG